MPDSQLGIIEYPKSDTHPEFTFTLRVNFKSSKPQEDFGFRFTGSEGTITTDVRTVTIERQPREKEPGFDVSTFTQAEQERYLREYRRKYPSAKPTAETLVSNKVEKFVFTADAHQDHMDNFIEALRTRKPHFEDSTFGLRAAGPALLANTSLFESRICLWDPIALKAS